ncbi:MAG TPA: type II CAAX endopeptidase family protein [Candidatus Acidoferrales bacterium]|nr:type II CAAX endopeptidase family protein [Candidatus Acidoferrales bacterium]
MCAFTSRRELSLTGAFLIWTALFLYGIFAGLNFGYGGPRFAVAMGAAAILLAGEIFVASPPTQVRVDAFLRSYTFLSASLVPLAAYLFYVLAGRFDRPIEILAGIAYVASPALLAASARGKSPGVWQDYVAILVIWLPVEFRWTYRLFPYPSQLTHTFTILLALNVAIAAFLFIRRLDGVGYAVEWGRGFVRAVIFNFVVLALIIIPLGEAIRFIHFGPTHASLSHAPLSGVEILVFTAWPEEFLFRGLLQNMLARSLKSRYAGWLAASVIFGFSHILHAPFPNWKYVFLATIAGLFYGRAWMKTGSIFPGTIVHALVDTTWFAFFPR